jgi:putative transposase
MSLSRACRLFGITRQALYKRNSFSMRRAIQLREVKELVVSKRRIMPRLGTRKLHYLLKEDFTARSIKLGRDNLFSFLRSEHLLIIRRRSYKKTTDSKHWLRKYPNLIKNKAITDIEQVWVSDITYLETEEKTTYLSLVTDAYSRKIVGHHLHDSLHTEGAALALKMALESRIKDSDLIHHSDRGIQYCSDQYQQIQRKAGVLCSMTDGYDCYQNALAERVNGILKEEFLVVKPKTMKQASQMVKQSIEIYNQQRPHLSLKLKTPEQIHSKKPKSFG